MIYMKRAIGIFLCVMATFLCGASVLFAQKVSVETLLKEMVNREERACYPAPSFVAGLSPYERRGHNLYFPIPYAGHCKVTYESEHLPEDDFGARRRETESV
jgi:hypothetical protein